MLSISRNHAKIHRGTRSTFELFHVPGLPDSLDDALWYERHENLLNAHAGPSFGNAGQTGTIHGGSTPSDEQKEQFDRYFKKVDHPVVAALQGQRAPLVIAAVEREVAGYRGLSEYQHIAKAAVVGNPDRLERSELHHDSWEAVEPELAAARHQLLDRFDRLAGTGKTSDDITQIETAAASGLVDLLFLAPGLDEADLARVNSLVVATLRTGGELIPELPDRVAPGTTMAALLRANVAGLA